MNPFLLGLFLMTFRTASSANMVAQASLPAMSEGHVAVGPQAKDFSPSSTMDIFSSQSVPSLQDDKLPVKPLPVPTGVIPLPQGPPPTGQQAPVPAPVQPLPKADQTLKVSPDLSAVNGYVQGKAITLQEAVAIALYTNREFATSVAALQQVQGRKGQARAALNPTLGVNGDLTVYDAATTADLGGFSGGQSANTPPFVITPQFNPTISATLTLPLDLNGTIRAAVNQAQFQEVAARIDINRVRNQTVYNVKNAFYNVLRAQAQIAVATDTLNNALSRLDDANKNYAAGTTPRFDVISAQRDVADSQQGLINARAQLSVNIAALKNVMGIAITSRLKLSDQNAVEYPPGVQPPTVPPVTPDTGKSETVPPTPIDTPPPVAVTPIRPEPVTQPAPGTPSEVEDTFDFGPEYAALLKEALETRPEVLESEAQIAAAQRGVQYARRSTQPSLNVSLSDVYSPNAAGFSRRNVGALTLGVRIPIFEGGLAKAREQEARGQVASAEVNRRQAVDQTQVEVQQAYVALVQARNRVAVANVGLSQAREAYRLARVRYNAGVSQQAGISPQLELSNAQTTLAQAQSNQINALYDYNNARAQIDRAVGRYAFTANGPGYTAPPPPRERGVSR